MTTLRNAASRRTVQQQPTQPDAEPTTKGEAMPSRYRLRIQELLLDKFPRVLNEKNPFRLTRVLAFLEQEMVSRDQDFLRSLAVCRPEMGENDARWDSFLKFTSAPTVTVRAISNNLNMPYARALGYILTLVALGAAQRVTTRGQSDQIVLRLASFNTVLMATTALRKGYGSFGGGIENLLAFFEIELAARKGTDTAQMLAGCLPTFRSGLTFENNASFAPGSRLDMSLADSDMLSKVLYNLCLNHLHLRRPFAQMFQPMNSVQTEVLYWLHAEPEDEVLADREVVKAVMASTPPPAQDAVEERERVKQNMANALAPQVTALQSQVRALEEQVAGLTESNTDNREMIEAIRTQVAELQGRPSGRGLRESYGEDDCADDCEDDDNETPKYSLNDMREAVEYAINCVIAQVVLKAHTFMPTKPNSHQLRVDAAVRIGEKILSSMPNFVEDALDLQIQSKG